VYVSTIYTYANLKNKKSTIESKQIYNDNISPYGLNKRIAELYVKELSSNYLIFRLPFIVGPGLKRNSVYDLTHFKKTFYTYNSQINWIHTDTIAKKVCNLLDRNISNQTFNLASKNSISIKKIMDLCKLSKKDIIKTNRTYEKTEINCDKIKKYISLPNSINEANKYISEYI